MGCIHHSERGSHDYRKLLTQHSFNASMSGKGNCYDNAVVEALFKTIKAELIWRHKMVLNQREQNRYQSS